MDNFFYLSLHSEQPECIDTNSKLVDSFVLRSFNMWSTTSLKIKINHRSQSSNLVYKQITRKAIHNIFLTHMSKFWNTSAKQQSSFPGDDPNHSCWPNRDLSNSNFLRQLYRLPGFSIRTNWTYSRPVQHLASMIIKITCTTHKLGRFLTLRA